ncbi:extracellular solute-binding protein [bacterium]|nr:extracellular solute-binding protein [bacterium]
MFNRKFYFLFSLCFSIAILFFSVSANLYAKTGNGPTITFWSFEAQPARAKATKGIIDRFTTKTGVNVKLILIAQENLGSIMAANYAAGTLPDVVFMPVVLAGGWEADGILDASAANKVIQSLGEKTFSQGALKMVSVKKGYAAVPSDGWGQLLVYRSDLFKKLKLDPPTDFNKILIAAKTLEESGLAGIMAGTDPGHPHTQSCIEHFMLANGVQLTDGKGNITLNTPKMVRAIELYTQLMKKYGPKDTSTYWRQTRASYLAGKAGMVLWSPFILDELAGLVNTSLPNCAECVNDRAFIAKNSGFVPAFSGPDGVPAQYGKVNYMGITTGADFNAATQFVTFWLNEGYLDWLEVAAEGKFPMRRGTQENPTKFIDGWSHLKVGVDTRATLSDFYGAKELETIIQGANNISLLGIAEGEIELVSAIYSELVFPRAIGDVMEGLITPEEAASQIQKEVEKLKKDLKE